MQRTTVSARTHWDIASLVLCTLGIGCYLGWHFVDISPTLFVQPQQFISELLSTWSYAYVALTVVVYVLLAYASLRHGFLGASKRFVILTSLIVTLGLALMYICGWGLAEPFGAGAVAGKLLAGFGVVQLVLWGEVLAHVKVSHMLAVVAGGYCISFCICLLIANLEPLTAMIFRCVLPLCSGALMLACHSSAFEITAVPVSDELEETTIDRDEQKFSLRSIPWRVLLGIGIFGAMITILNHLSESKSDVSTEVYTLIAGVAVSGIIVCVAVVRRSKPLDFGMLYRLLTPLLIGAVLLTLVLQEGFQRYEALAIGCAWVFFRIFTWTMWGRVAAPNPSRGACVFALGALVMSLCSTLAEIICLFIDFRATPLAVSIAVIILCAVVTSALIMNESSLAGFAPAGVQVPLQDTGEQPAAAPVESAKLDLSSITAVDVAHALQDKGLSEREAEVALLVLQGKNNSQIASEACIAQSTLRTHLRNIYAKLDVHSRTELVDLLVQKLGI
ncbi:MAG: helix-turn-helix transcriptional regulator [Coriobacteriales bacterium]|nr:helix-turn-helix transcriptional regulator [Coriobacteriales bacterium]